MDKLNLLAVYTTVAKQTDADQLAQQAVTKSLAACVQVEQIASTYRWQNNICHETEYRIMFKTTQTGYLALKQWLESHHPYTLPAIYALPVLDASAPYADWVAKSVQA